MYVETVLMPRTHGAQEMPSCPPRARSICLSEMRQPQARPRGPLDRYTDGGSLPPGHQGHRWRTVGGTILRHILCRPRDAGRTEPPLSTAASCRVTASLVPAFPTLPWGITRRLVAVTSTRKESCDVGRWSWTWGAEPAAPPLQGELQTGFRSWGIFAGL